MKAVHNAYLVLQVHKRRHVVIVVSSKGSDMLQQHLHDLGSVSRRGFVKRTVSILKLPMTPAFNIMESKFRTENVVTHRRLQLSKVSACIKK